MSFYRTVCLAVLTICSLAITAVPDVHSITIKPAAFDRIEAEVPKEVMAGEEFEVKVTFMDRFGNAMPDSWKPDEPVSLTVSKPASVLPPILTPDNYIPAIPAITSTWTASRDKFLPSECFTTIASITCFYLDSGPIDKHPDGKCCGRKDLSAGGVLCTERFDILPVYKD